MTQALYQVIRLCPNKPALVSNVTSTDLFSLAIYIDNKMSNCVGLVVDGNNVLNQDFIFSDFELNLPAPTRQIS